MTAEASDLPRFSLRTLLVAVTIVAVTLGMLLWLGRAVSNLAISEATANSIYDGMTREQVREVAGPPHRVDNHGYYLYNVWNGLVFYSDPLSVGFDDEGRVNWVSF